MPEIKRSFRGLLASRKFQTACAAVIVSVGAYWGFDIPIELALSIMGIGGIVIAGTAYEDGKEKGAGGETK